MTYKTRTNYSAGKGQCDCKCFKGSQCANYLKECKECIMIQGKYTNFEEYKSKGIAFPKSAHERDIFFHTDENKYYVCTGSYWNILY